MAQNLEVKIKIENLDEMFSKVRLLGADYKELLMQKDVYYTVKSGLLKLRIVNGEYQLIKYNRDENSLDRWSDYEILMLEGENVEQFLSSILSVEAVVEKERTLYIYNNTRIHIDDVSGLGAYLELETVVGSSQDRAKKEFNFVVSALELDLQKQIKTSYRFLVGAK